MTRLRALVALVVGAEADVAARLAADGVLLPKPCQAGRPVDVVDAVDPRRDRRKPVSAGRECLLYQSGSWSFCSERSTRSSCSDLARSPRPAFTSSSRKRSMLRARDSGDSARAGSSSE
uniref:Putative secreted protein n=1 Tax=Ixodes ricinus TaxID=34613 RepID=A0A6B0UM19_IXORI